MSNPANDNDVSIDRPLVVDWVDELKQCFPPPHAPEIHVRLLVEEIILVNPTVPALNGAMWSFTLFRTPPIDDAPRAN